MPELKVKGGAIVKLYSPVLVINEVLYPVKETQP
jgi:hypothetical protein